MIRRNLKEMSKDVYNAYRQDGIYSMVGGIALCLCAGFFVNDPPYTWALIFGVGIFITLPQILRHYITIPRVGYVKTQRPRGMRNVFPNFIVPILFGLAFYLIGTRSVFQWLMPGLIGLTLSLVYFQAGRQAGSMVDYSISACCLFSAIVGVSLTKYGLPSGWITAGQLWLISGILIPIGIAQFIFFLKKYPLTPENQTNGLAR